MDGQWTIHSSIGISCCKDGTMHRCGCQTNMETQGAAKDADIWMVGRAKLNILTHDNLRKKGLHIVSRCTLCKNGSETLRHLLKDCPYTGQIYRELKVENPSDAWPDQPVLNIVRRSRLTAEQKSMVRIMQFVIWRERCARSFAEKGRTTSEITQDTLQQIQMMRCQRTHTGTGIDMEQLGAGTYPRGE